MNVHDMGKYKNVFEADGDDWKRLRQTINPVFTARRMKEVATCCVRLKYLRFHLRLRLTDGNLVDFGKR